MLRDRVAHIGHRALPRAYGCLSAASDACTMLELKEKGSSKKTEESASFALVLVSVLPLLWRVARALVGNVNNGRHRHEGPHLSEIISSASADVTSSQ